jgi:hypothetical protein
MVCSACGQMLVDEPTREEAQRAVREATGIDDGKDPMKKAWGDVRGWYKRNFNVDDGDTVDGEPPDNK